MKKRVMYCQTCGCSQVVEGTLDQKKGTGGRSSLHPCTECTGVVFHRERKTEWRPFDKGRVTVHDVRFLRSIRVKPYDP